MPNHKEQKGYFTFAQNNDTTDYLEIAYLQALSIKATQKINSYAVAVDETTQALITDKHRNLFDYIVTIREDNAINDKWKLANEWQAHNLTPFKETIKLDSDIIFNRNIDHWWHNLQQKEVCCTTEVRDYKGNISNSREYRKQFDLNNLPNVYSGFTYFRYSQTSTTFFNHVKSIYKNWALYRDEILINCREELPVTDEVYAIACMFMDTQCYLPNNGPSFAHMKGAINGWGLTEDWTNRLYAQVDDKAHLMVGGIRQQYPFHYVSKEFCTEELIEKYERILESIRAS